jgi:hypothetical protein
MIFPSATSCQGKANNGVAIARRGIVPAPDAPLASENIHNSSQSQVDKVI